MAEDKCYNVRDVYFINELTMLVFHPCHVKYRKDIFITMKYKIYLHEVQDIYYLRMKFQKIIPCVLLKSYIPSVSRNFILEILC